LSSGNLLLEHRLPASKRRQLADEILFPGSARVSRVGFDVSPKQSLQKSPRSRGRDR